MNEPQHEDIIQSRKNIRLIQNEIDLTAKYIDDLKLPDISDQNFDKILERRKKLIDNLFSWQEKFNEISGIISFYDYVKEKEKEANEKNKAYKGTYNSGASSRIRKKVKDKLEPTNDE